MAKTIRIQKYLGDGGILSRRKTEEYIKAGRITVNGRPAALGHPVGPGDVIAIDGQRVRVEWDKENLYIMLNKPRGYVTTTSDELGRRCVTQLLEGVEARVYPVGRLDKDSEGLLLLTNDGALAHRLLAPKRHVDKVYSIRTDRPLGPADAEAFASGMVLEDGTVCLPARLEPLGDGREALVTLHEGKFHQIKRMIAGRGASVCWLKRLSMGTLVLDKSLAPGEFRLLTREEVSKIGGKP